MADYLCKKFSPII